jgi:hypothetical protein
MLSISGLLTPLYALLVAIVTVLLMVTLAEGQRKKAERDAKAKKKVKRHVPNP